MKTTKIGQRQQNNKDRLVNNLCDRVADIDNDELPLGNVQPQSDSDHDYYLDIGMEPPRFAQYRLARSRHKDAFRGLTYEDVWDSITQDELDYYLKSRLREPPEERYQRIRREPWIHETGWATRGLNAYDGQGCNHFYGCIPECRFYPKVGRIEDDEVIENHNKWVESYKQRNAIVEPSVLLSFLTPAERERPYFQEYYDDRDQP